MSNEKIRFMEGSNAKDEKDLEEEYEQLLAEADIEESRIQLPRNYLSVSQVNMFRRCPRQYYFRYVKGEIVAPSSALVEGTAVHTGLEVGHRESLRVDRVPVDVMLDAYHDTWKEQKQDIVWGEGETEDVLVDRDQKFLTTYNKDFLHSLYPEVGEDGAPMVERRFWMTVGECSIPFLGFIDLVAENHVIPVIGETDKKKKKKKPDDPDDPGTGELEVIDHKVVGRMIPRDRVHSDLQLTAYAAATGLTNVRFHCFLKTKNPTIRTIASTRGRRSIRWFEHVVTEIAKSINTGLFPPGSSEWWCSPKWCGYWDLCQKEVCDG